MNKLGIGIGLVLVGLLFTQFVRSVSTPSEGEERYFARHVNLALRRTAHLLLREQGDSTSRISPVQQSGPRTFTIRLENAFEYDRIPKLLQASLKQHHVETAYEVTVLDCTSGEIQLGYTFRDLSSPEGIACTGRIQQQGCHTLQVAFSEPVDAKADVWWAGTLGFLLAGLGGLLWYQVARKKASDPEPIAMEEMVAESDLLQFGQVEFNPKDQSIRVAGQAHTLTYRETKLLRLFAGHPNQLLERDYILKAVWEDEGIIVGRSVDVFVSRLRKILQNDPSIRIASVHGVGYRLEIRTEAA